MNFVFMKFISYVSKKYSCDILRFKKKTLNASTERGFYVTKRTDRYKSLRAAVGSWFSFDFNRQQIFVSTNIRREHCNIF